MAIPTQTTEDNFDQSTDNATHAVVTEFEWCALPEGDQLSALMVRINDAITAIMQDFKPT
jgi:hypothetical protein